MKFWWVVYISAIGVTTGCDQAPDPAVAQVGPHSISATSLRAFVADLPEGLRIEERGDDARRRYLQDLVDGRLLLMEARARGLDTTEAVRTAVRSAIDARARNLYRHREIDAKISVTEEEVRHRFDAEGYDVERKLYAILVDSREDILDVAEKLRRGEPFEEVARTRSLDKRSAEQGGELGFIDPNMALRLNVPLDVFRTLPLGAVSEPLNAAGRWHVVRFTEERPGDFGKFGDFIRSRLIREREMQAEDEHLEELERAFQLRLDAEVLNKLVEAFRTKALDRLATDPSGLYHYDKGEISLREVLRGSQRMLLYRVLADSSGPLVGLRKTILRPFLLAEAAKRAGIYDEPEIRQLEQERLEDALLETLKKVAITQQIDVSEEEARQFYDNRPELFHHEAAAWVEELLLSTEVEARQVKLELEAGTTFGELAEHSQRKSAVKNAAQFHFHPREKVLYPKLVPAIMAAEPGGLIGPVEVNDGFSLFRVLRRAESKLEPFASSSRRARALVRRQWENRGLESLVKELRSKYASQITIDESQLQQALPDELVEN